MTSFFKSLPADAGPPNVFMTYPEIYRSWAAMSQALMNGASPLSPGERELILAYAAGWDEHALHDAIAVTARSAFMQTLVQGHGFTPLPQEISARNAEKRVKLGYVNLYPGFRDKG